MRVRLVIFSVLLTFLTGGLAYAAEEPQYYLALGDSLAVGFQPTAAGGHATNQGYVDDLYTLARLRMPSLQLVKLGCAGEATFTMIYGGVCAYAQGSQLNQAIRFLEEHPRQVAFITLDIGANDVDGCYTLSPLAVDQGCFQGGLGSDNPFGGLSAVGANLPAILTALQGAAPGVPIIGANYYNPFVAAWQLVPGPVGQTFAVDSEIATVGFNTTLATAYGLVHVPVADVAAAYHIADFALVPVLKLPLNVFLTLSWTWMSAAPPVGPDIHPNGIGYAVIAGAFVRAFETP